MQIREMRSALNAGNLGKGMSELPETMPDWVVRSIYERRNRLPRTKLPAGIEVKSLSRIMVTSRAQRPKAVVVTDEADRDLARLRLAVARLQ